jgi:para-aminobenzoate synthetase component I
VKRVYRAFAVSGGNDLLPKALPWASKYFDTCCLLNSNSYKRDKYASVEQILAIGEADACLDNGTNAFGILRQFSDLHPDDWLFGFLTYDLKNQLERLHSSHVDGIRMPGMHFFRPIILITANPHQWTIGCLPGYGKFSDPAYVMETISKNLYTPLPDTGVGAIRGRVSRDEYINKVEAIQSHIQQGDIYEMNYCVEFYDDNASIDPLHVYARLNTLSPSPFSCFYQLDEKYLLCASPERFLKKTGKNVVSQPIKGTIARSDDPVQDEKQRHTLSHDPKERSENVMIVDLVRNDLSRTAKDGSVEVEELCGLYPFRHVYQMISTVKAEIDDGIHFVDTIRHAFPMGSMTGAPKLRAMQLIEEYEDTKRGLYSGAVGYITPEKDFDFNVVIRSIQYNARAKYLNFMAGSAITAASVPEKEYDECLLKAAAMRKALEG